MSATKTRKQSRPLEDDIDDADDIYVTRSPSSTIRYNRPVDHDTVDDPALIQGAFIARRRSSLNPKSTSGIASKAISSPGIAEKQRSRHFPWVAMLIGMLVMGLLGVALINLGSWWRVHQDDARYGRPRTFQLDAVVGHNDSSSNPTHFICLNLNRHVEIIELPGGDASHARVFIGPVLFGDGQDLTPVTAEIQDVNHDGKPDLIVHIQDQQLVYINDGTTFHLQQQQSGGH